MTDSYEWTDARGIVWIATNTGEVTRVFYKSEGKLHNPGGSNGETAVVIELLRLVHDGIVKA